MEGLTWRALAAPEYVMTFLEGFLLLFLSGLGFDVAANAAQMAGLQWPTPPTIFAAAMGGMINGIRALRNLRAPAPTPRNGDPAIRGRRASDSPSPDAGGS